MSRPRTTDRVRSLFAGTATRYDAVVRTATLGMDFHWKRRMIAAIPTDREYDRILDLACGTGIVTFALADRFPNAEIVGLDVSPNMLAVARDRKDHDNVRFVEKPAEEMDDFGRRSFDLVTTSYLPKYTDIQLLATNTAKVLTDNGAAIFHDFTYPRSRPYVAFFEAYWALLQRILPHIPGYEEFSVELRDLIVDASRWPEELRESLRRAGFDRTTVRWQLLEIAAIVTADVTA